MHTENCNFMTNNGNFFDITHSFKSGSATYHVLGLRKDRPTYKNTYYIFNCTGNQHDSAPYSLSKSAQFQRSVRISEHRSLPKRRPLTALHRKTTSTEELPAEDAQETKSDISRPRTRTESPKKLNIETSVIQETFTKILRNDRQRLMTSLRKEMNIKKRSLVRTIKKEKQELLQATKEANTKDEIIRLLEEQKTSLESICERCINTTVSSLDTLKQTLIETLETQHNISQSIEQLQLTLMQTVEQEIQKILLKNEDILRSTSAETNAINEMQNTLVQKIEEYSNTKTNDDETLNRLFAEQTQTLTNVVAEQQQELSLARIKQTMVDVFNEQKSMSVNMNNNLGHSDDYVNDKITNISSQQVVMNNNTISNKNTLPKMKPNQNTRNTQQSSLKINSKYIKDQHLFKVSIFSPEPAHIYAKLIIDGIECSRRLHTLCQHDPIQKDLFNCYIAPPTKDGLYEITIYAKTNKETAYRAAISIRLPGPNISQSITFPMVHQSFERHQCILIEPLRRLLQQNEQVLIHMIVPGAHLVKIRNGDETIELDMNEYKKGVVKKQIRVRGDIYVIGCWDKKTDSTICVFNMI